MPEITNKITTKICMVMAGRLKKPNTTIGIPEQRLRTSQRRLADKKKPNSNSRQETALSSTQEDEDGDDIDDEDNVCIGDVDDDAHRKN